MSSTIQLSVDLINNVLGYLGKQPYQEVYHLINGIQVAGAQQQVAQPAPVETAPVETAPIEATNDATQGE